MTFAALPIYIMIALDDDFRGRFWVGPALRVEVRIGELQPLRAGEPAPDGGMVVMIDRRQEPDGLELG